MQPSGCYRRAEADVESAKLKYPHANNLMNPSRN